MAVNINLVRNVLFSIILLIILYQVLADTATDIGSASDSLAVTNSTNGTDAGKDIYPLTSFFKKKGIILLALMAGIVIVAITAFMGGKK